MTPRTTETDTSPRAICRALAAGALFHDLGKFAERSIDVPSPDSATVQQEYRYGHAHATAEVLTMLFGTFATEQLPDGAADETFANLASRHHNPRYFLEQILQVADWWASGHERAQADQTAKDFETTGRSRKEQRPLLSILGRIRLEHVHHPQTADWHYPLRPHALGDPLAEEHLYPRSPNEYTHDTVQRDYPGLWRQFCRALGAENGPSPLHPIDDMETLFEICRQYQWCIPASTRVGDMPDVSLFEHAKGTAAIASCLYLYHADEAQPPNHATLANKTPEKFQLFCADIAGIQNFIYQISSKGAYKLLKGRSFYVQLLSEVIARHVVHDLNLTVANILYASGGKCYLLLPNKPWVNERLTALFAELNQRLFQAFNGGLHVRHGCAAVSGADLCRENQRTLNVLWEDLGQQVARSDRKRFADIAPDALYDAVFAVNTREDHATCVVCHATTTRGRQDNKCNICSSLQELGRQLGEAQFILVSKDRRACGERPVLELPFGYHVWCLETQPATLAAPGLVLWSVNSSAYVQASANVTIRRHVPCAPLMLGSNHRFDKDFEAIAQCSKGIKRLGILRMDVDNLGTIFSKGLVNYAHQVGTHDGRFHSLARITTLSWQLRLFFEGILPRLVHTGADNEQRVTVVYSGGDDLFLLGAWDALPELALKIRQEFSRFCCQNPAFTLSGGLVLTGGSFPVYKSAELAGHEEAKAKQLKSFIGTSTIEKAAFSFLETPMHWEEFERIKEMKDALDTLLQDGNNWPLLRRLRNIALSWSESRDALKRRKPEYEMRKIIQDIEAERWRWRMVYSLARYAQGNAALRPELDKITQFIVKDIGASRRSGIELLHVPVRWVEYCHRDSNTNQEAQRV